MQILIATQPPTPVCVEVWELPLCYARLFQELIDKKWENSRIFFVNDNAEYDYVLD